MDTLFLLALISGGFMAWAVGANDVANAMGTSVGSKIITIKQAIFIAAIFEGLGALFGSGTVTHTLRNDVIDIEFYANDGLYLARGMIASLLASASWLIIASHKGWPVSTTHSIIGALIGFCVVSSGVNHVQWWNILQIGLSWLVCPVVSAIFAWLCFRVIQIYVLSHIDPIRRAEYFVAVSLSIAIIFFSNFLFIYFDKASWMHYIFSLAIGVVNFYIVRQLLYMKNSKILPYRIQCQRAEQLFGRLALVTACLMAFAHGANDVANAIGPMVSVVDILKYGYLPPQSEIPLWVLLWGSAGVVLGLAMFGYKIIASVGTKITSLSPSRSFSAQLATAVVILSASWYGYPVSTTQTLVGAVFGVGLARGLAAVNMSIIRGILMSWVVTIPTGAVFSIVFFQGLGLIV